MVRSAAFSCNGRDYRAPSRRTLAICIDGTAPAYLEEALAGGGMPRLEAALRDGGRELVGRAQVPTLTNVNNASIVTGVSAARHGIAGNHYLAPDGHERQLTDPQALRVPTILQAARAAGIAALAVTAKDKLRALLGAGGVPSISAELAAEQTVDGLDGASGADVVGAPNPGIYDPALSAYTVDLALSVARRLGSQLVYCSLTDYVQHTAGPASDLAREFYAGLDARLGAAMDEGWVVGMAADHGMNDKSDADGRPNVRFLVDALREAGAEHARVVLPITDPYVAHHGALASVAYVYLPPGDLDRASAAIHGLQGVEAILDRAAAARAFDLPPDRIGNLVVLADEATVLGKSIDEHDFAALPGRLRSHGGLHEQTVPIVICQPLATAPPPDRPLHNRDLFDLLLNHVAA